MPRACLGRDPWLEGVVERGDARGRELGVPTANLALERTSVRPARGVYAGMAVLQDGRRIPAAISVGWNPTFGEGRPLTVEAHLLDFSGDLYDQRLRLEFRKFLRHELRFEDVDELVAQMQLDIEQTRELTRDGVRLPVGARPVGRSSHAAGSTGDLRQRFDG